MTTTILRVTRLTALFTAAVAFTGAAQRTTIIIGKPPTDGPASFGGSGASPISSTAVIQFLLEPRDSGGAQLAYAIVIRGTPDWYRQHTAWASTDSIPGFQAVSWSVGAVHYVVAYDSTRHLLRTFGKEIDLTRANLVLVALGSAGATDATVSAEHRISFVMLQPGGFVEAFLPYVPEVRSFAGIQ
jgi:hypothetical protein